MKRLALAQEGYGPMQSRLDVSFVVVAGLAMSVGLLGCGRSEEVSAADAATKVETRMVEGGLRLNRRRFTELRCVFSSSRRSRAARDGTVGRRLRFTTSPVRTSSAMRSRASSRLRA